MKISRDRQHNLSFYQEIPACLAQKRSPKHRLRSNCLEADTTLGLLFTTEFEVLAALVDKLVLSLARSAFKTNDSLLGSLGLLVEDGLGLTTITGLLTIVTALT